METARHDRMVGMDFGPVQTELLPGARNAIGTCLAVRPQERVALIADRASRAVAASLAATLDERRAAWQGLLLEDFAQRPLTGAPPEVIEAFETSDVGILCMQPLPGELGARMSIVRTVEQRQIRYAHMVGVTPEIMQQGMLADYHEIDRDRKSTRLNSSHIQKSRMPSSA